MYFPILCSVFSKYFPSIIIIVIITIIITIAIHRRRRRRYVESISFSRSNRFK